MRPPALGVRGASRACADPARWLRRRGMPRCGACDSRSPSLGVLRAMGARGVRRALPRACSACPGGDRPPPGGSPARRARSSPGGARSRVVRPCITSPRARICAPSRGDRRVRVVEDHTRVGQDGTRDRDPLALAAQSEKPRSPMAWVACCRAAISRARPRAVPRARISACPASGWANARGRTLSLNRRCPRDMPTWLRSSRSASSRMLRRRAGAARAGFVEALVSFRRLLRAVLSDRAIDWPAHDHKSPASTAARPWCRAKRPARAHLARPLRGGGRTRGGRRGIGSATPYRPRHAIAAVAALRVAMIAGMRAG